MAKRKVKKGKESSSNSTSSKISTADMSRIVDKLMNMQHRNSTAKNYLSIWRQFNKFVLSLDVRPNLWEDRTTLFLGYLINNGMQSSTIKSYVSAIKKTLLMDGYEWNDKLVLVRSLAKACRIINDHVRIRLPIHSSLLEVILFEVQRSFSERHQHYLEILYKTLFAISYYGLMRIGEVSTSPHVLKACNVHIATNKEKILLVLYSSKTHDKSSLPQEIKITSNGSNNNKKFFCPFKLMRQYMSLRGGYSSDQEQFFIFRDGSPVGPYHVRRVLKMAIEKIGLNSTLYGMHSLRIGRTTDLVRYNCPIEKIRIMGRWKSNVIYKYIR